ALANTPESAKGKRQEKPRMAISPCSRRRIENRKPAANVKNASRCMGKTDTASATEDARPRSVPHGAAAQQPAELTVATQITPRQTMRRNKQTRATKVVS